MTITGRIGPRFLAAAVLFASVAASGCASSSSSSQDEFDRDPESDYARDGIYLGLYGIAAFEDFHTSGPGVSSGNSDLGIGAKVGYRATPNVAVEVIAENVKGFEVSSSSVESDLRLVNFGVMGKYYFMTERFQPYLLVGGGVASAHVAHFDYDNNGGFVRGGLGADFYLSHSIALFAEANYNRMMGGVSDLHHIDLQLGLIFRF